MSVVVAEVFGHWRPRLLGLKKKLPYIFVLHAEEPLQGPGTCRIKLPHMESPTLAGENPAKQHHLDYAGKAGVLLHHALNALLQCHHLIG